MRVSERLINSVGKHSGFSLKETREIRKNLRNIPYVVDTTTHALMSAFSWANSLQSASYWYKIHIRLRQNRLEQARLKQKVIINPPVDDRKFEDDTII